MSTSCVVRFIEDEDVICAFYKHCDGGSFERTLDDFLEEFKLVEGLPLHYERRIANGMGDLAAQVIAHFKVGPGEIYMCNPKNEGDFTYEVYAYNYGKILSRRIN